MLLLLVDADVVELIPLADPLRDRLLRPAPHHHGTFAAALPRLLLHLAAPDFARRRLGRLRGRQPPSHRGAQQEKDSLDLSHIPVVRLFVFFVLGSLNGGDGRDLEVSTFSLRMSIIF